MYAEYFDFDTNALFKYQRSRNDGKGAITKVTYTSSSTKKSIKSTIKIAIWQKSASEVTAYDQIKAPSDHTIAMPYSTFGAGITKDYIAIIGSDTYTLARPDNAQLESNIIFINAKRLYG